MGFALSDMQLESVALDAGGAIARTHAGERDDVPPPFSWVWCSGEHQIVRTGLPRSRRATRKTRPLRLRALGAPQPVNKLGLRARPVGEFPFPL